MEWIKIEYVDEAPMYVDLLFMWADKKRVAVGSLDKEKHVLIVNCPDAAYPINRFSHYAFINYQV